MESLVDSIGSEVRNQLRKYENATTNADTMVRIVFVVCIRSFFPPSFFARIGRMNPEKPKKISHLTSRMPR